MVRFSKRLGYHEVKQSKIKIFDDAPEDFREFLISIFYEFGLLPSQLRYLICRLLRKTPDKNNWSEYPNIDEEFQKLLYGCEWYKVYDFIEVLINNPDFDLNYDNLVNEINEYFVENGYSWIINKKIIERRYSDVSEELIKHAREAIDSSSYPTVSSEFEESIKDLSRRPNPDLTGAIQHSMAGLECLFREVSGDKKSNLGDLLKKFNSIIPQPLDQAIDKIWGYASEHSRHIREGREPGMKESRLIVSITCAISEYLLCSDIELKK
ncbi:MAG: hypothetical protein WCX96_04415 [Bacilli bacterium]